MKKLFILIALFVSVQSFAQIETDTHVFWQPGAKLTFDMFQGAAPDSAYVKKLTDLNIYFEIATGLWGVLDIPNSKRAWKNIISARQWKRAIPSSSSRTVQS